MGVVTIGIDIGQKVDPTAIAVAEAQQRPSVGVTYVIRHLERLPLGTPYPKVATRLREIVEGVPRQMIKEAQEAAEATRQAQGQRSPFRITSDSPTSGTMPRVFADATGVGQPVVDLLKAGGTVVWSCYFTYGDRRTVDDKKQVSIGKAWLVSRLQALLQTGRLLLPKTAEATALAKELQDYEIKVDQDANEKYGAFRVGAHDDLVTALGLAVQEEPGRPFSAAVGGQRAVTQYKNGTPMPPSDWRDWR